MAIKRAIAAAIDVVAVALLGYLGFRLAVPASGCHDLGSCPMLTPLIAVTALVLIVVYFAVAYVLWRRTLGQRLLRVSEDQGITGTDF